MNKIGYCCKTVVPDSRHGIRNIPELNFRSTTATWLRTHPQEAEQRLWDITEHNLQALERLVKIVGEQDEHRRMVRIGSDLWPLATHPETGYFWQRSDVLTMARTILEPIGDYCRSRNLRLSQHPGQYVCLASDSEDVVDRSIEEFEYHATVARMMGYGQSWHDHGFKINIHVSGRRGVDGFRAAWRRLSTEARNLITIENEEMTYGLDSVLALADDVAVVLDVHHHWVHTGEYIRPSDDRVRRVIDSWRGVRPVLHYSVSREDVLVGHDVNQLPDRDALLASGLNKMRLRAHSDRYWNRACNQWVSEFKNQFDIQAEAKHKNLAADELSAMIS